MFLNGSSSILSLLLLPHTHSLTRFRLALHNTQQQQAHITTAQFEWKMDEWGKIFSIIFMTSHLTLLQPPPPLHDVTFLIIQLIYFLSFFIHLFIYFFVAMHEFQSPYKFKYRSLNLWIIDKHHFRIINGCCFDRWANQMRNDSENFRHFVWIIIIYNKRQTTFYRLENKLIQQQYSKQAHH